MENKELLELSINTAIDLVGILEGEGASSYYSKTLKRVVTIEECEKGINYLKKLLNEA